MEPFRRLLLGGATAEDSILVPGWTSPFYAIIPSLRRRHFLVAQICFISILSEFLPIILANIAFSPAMTEEAYFTCTYLAMIILTLMLIGITILIFRPRHRLRPLPRKPTTLASVLLYITNSGEFKEQCMLGSMQSLSVLDQWERDECIKEFRSRYTMGLVAGNDLRIDEDRRIEKLWED
jgi:fluoride exporter